VKLQEALPLSVAKKYSKNKLYKNILPQLFNNEYRLYFPISLDLDLSETNPFNKLKQIFPQLTQEDYLSGLVNIQIEKLNKLTGEKKVVSQKMSLVKALRQQPNVENLKELEDAIRDDPNRAGKGNNDYEIVISRHPYDIAGMSSDRNWTSCMDLGLVGIVYKDKTVNNGINNIYIKSFIEEGGLISYLIKSDDKNINKPLGRALIVPYKSEQNNEIYYKVPDKIYGSVINENKFIKEVQKILDIKVNKNLKSLYFKLSNKIYDDSYERIILNSNDKILKKIYKNPSYIKNIKNPTEEQILLAVTKNDETLKYIENQTPEICLQAVKHHGYALRYVKNQTHEICLEAVKQDGIALIFVKNQTHEICLAAVEQNGHSLQFVKEQTEKICLAAVKQKGNALQHVKEQTDEICLIAVKQHGLTLRYVKNQTHEICLAAVKKDGHSLQFVKEQTHEICLEAVKEISSALWFIVDINLKDKIKKELNLGENITNYKKYILNFI
jgi:hypothetical protein